jgi:U1 small nuclear ribonucleoprotein C
MSVRKAHNAGKNHLRNVLDYYQRQRHSLALPIEGIHILTWAPEIGHEKAQSVIDSITSSYAAEGQAGANPMLGGQQGPGGPPFPPPPFGFPGGVVPPFPMGPPPPGGFPRES